MVETRAWKEVRKLSENSQCRLCKEQWERERESPTSLSRMQHASKQWISGKT